MKIEPAAPRARPLRSLRQQYEEFILQRIEEYKDGLSREELLKIGDEAVEELETNAAEQYVLTEVLLLEHVDRIIMRRLKLPSYRRWRTKYVALRAAQRELTHWGLEADPGLVARAGRLDPEDTALVVGASRCNAALFLAAHEARVVLVDQDLTAVEMAENRAATEQLASYFEAYVVRFGDWLPQCRPLLVIVDAGALADADAGARRLLIEDLKTRTREGGVHLVLPGGPPQPQVIPLAPDTLQQLYDDWVVERWARGNRRPQGFVATKPPRPSDAQAVSD